MSSLADELRRGIDPQNIPEAESLMDKAANEIERLRSIVRVNGLRWGHTHGEIDAILYPKNNPQ